MVQPEDIRRKAEAIYFEFLRAWLDGGESYFPRTVPAQRNPGDDLSSAIRAVRRLRDGSREALGYGYNIEWREVNSRKFGRNQFPERITFQTQEDLLRFVNKQREFALFTAAASRLRSEFPSLGPWLRSNVRDFIGAAEELDGLLGILRYLVSHPRPECFARELPVPVDTKFVERNKGILRQWLDLVLPAHAIRADEDHFERRFGLQYLENHLLLRFLDPEVQRELGFPCSVLSLPLHTLGGWSMNRGVRVVIVENKVNLLTMPPLPRTMAIGGLGNGVALLRYIPWLVSTSIVYWGDLDTEGLEILSRLRALFPHTRSVMMDEPAIARWRHLKVQGTGRKPVPPPHLSSSERVAFELCVEKNLRLEQERIPQSAVIEIFADLG
jgi:hypothetical protein